MNSTNVSLGMGAKIFVWLAGFLGAMNLFDFIAHGWGTDDLLMAAGFFLIAYGTYRNGFGQPRDAAGERVAIDAGGRWASLLGMGLVVAALVLESG